VSGEQAANGAPSSAAGIVGEGQEVVELLELCRLHVVEVPQGGAVWLFALE
jgi:hypothetical protein